MTKPERFTRRHKDRCQESAIYQSKDNVRLERDAQGNPTGIVRGLRVLNKESKPNNRLFKRNAHNDVINQINNGERPIRVNLNHTKSKSDSFAPPEPEVQNRFGRLFNARPDDNDPSATNADLRYNPRHSFAPAFEWFVENDPGAIGLSIDAILQGPYLENGQRAVESVPRLFSVDIVGDPGSTKSLFEEEMADEFKDDANSDASLDMSDLKDSSDSGSGGDSSEHLCNLVKSLISEGKLDQHQLLKLVMKVMKSESDSGESSEPESEAVSEKENKTSAGSESASAESEELKKLRAEVDTFRAKEAMSKLRTEARDKCKHAGLNDVLVTDVFIDTMCDRGKESWEALISDRKLQTGDTVRSSGSGGGEPDLDEFVRTMGANS